MECRSWCSDSAIHIVAKRQGSKRENRQLVARVAMAAALWHYAPNPKPWVTYVASDVHGPDCAPDSELVRSLLTGRFEVPPACQLLRSKANCTFLEVRWVRALARARGFRRIVALTHSYHVARAQRYFDEALPGVTVLPVDLRGLALTFRSPGQPKFYREIPLLVRQAQPGLPDLLRELVVEGLLRGLHALDPRGGLERRMADRVRPGPL